MRIGMISPYYFPNIKGGGEISLRMLSEALVIRGCEVIVITFDGREMKEEVISNVGIIRYPSITEMAHPLALIPQVLLAMKRFEKEVDLFHMHNMSTLPGGGLYKLLRGKKPVVATLNSYVGFCPIGSAVCIATKKECALISRTKCLNSRKMAPRILSFLYAIVYPILTSLSKRLDRYVAPSRVVKYVYECQHYASDRIEVVPYFHPKATTFNCNHKGQTFNILYVGMLDVHKGVDILIRAFSYLAKYYKDINLIIVGDGPESKEYKKLARELGTSGRVNFTGDVAGPWKYYQIADVFVHPAIWFEPFGRTILEALYFRLPIIASNVGAPQEIIKDAGLVFERGNVEDLIRNLKALIENDVLRERLKSNCSKVLEEYNPEKLLARMMGVYEKVLRS